MTEIGNKNIQLPPIATLKHVNVKFLEMVFEDYVIPGEKEEKRVTISSTFPRDRLEIPSIIVSHPASSLNWSGLGKEIGLDIRTLEESVIKGAGAEELGFTGSGVVMVRAIANDPTIRDDIMSRIFGAYAILDCWFYSRPEIRIHSLTITGYNDPEYSDYLSPQYLWQSSIRINFVYDISAKEFYNYIRSIVKKVYLNDPISSQTIMISDETYQ